jgi:hypothetical protein
MLLGESEQRTYSLSTSQIHNDFWFAVVLVKELTHDLLDGVHTKPIASIDEGIAAHIFGREWLIVVGFLGEVQFGYTSFGHDAAVVGLSPVSVR